MRRPVNPDVGRAVAGFECQRRRGEAHRLEIAVEPALGAVARRAEQGVRILRQFAGVEGRLPAAVEQRAAHAEHDIVTQAYSPLGVGKLLDNPTVTSLAAEYGKSPAQVLIRWNLQLGNSVVARSAKAERIAENMDVFDFELAESHLAALTALDDGTRFRPDPATYTGA